MTETTKHKALAAEGAKVRLDKWLWAARFFKTRGLATEAIRGGHIHLNASRPKASRAIQPGDEIRIRKSQQEWVVMVRALSEQRRPASEAVLLYEETAQSRDRRRQQQENNRLLSSAAAPTFNRRPDKCDRCRIRRLSGRG